MSGDERGEHAGQPGQPGRGPEGSGDPGLFGPESVAWRVHGDPAMLLGGMRALLLQACHPLVMAGFDVKTRFYDDPWGRLERTSHFVETVVHGTRAEAEEAGRRVRRIHALLGEVPDPSTGSTYRIDDPDLLTWVHVTEVESFLSTYRRSGGALTAAQADRYVDEMSESARLVGLDPAAVPRTTAAVDAYYDAVRPQLRVIPAARSGALRGAVLPMPAWVQLATPARPLWASLWSTAAGLLPRWARRLYGLPGLPTTDLAAATTATIVRSALLVVPASVRTPPIRRAALERVAA